MRAEYTHKRVKQMYRKQYQKIKAIVLVAVVGLSSISIHAGQTDKQGFDYSDYNAVLKKFVNEEAMVNYKKLKAERQQLDSFVTSLGKLPKQTYEKWDEKQKIAFWLNAYNGLTLKAIIDNYPIKSSWLKSRIYPKNSIRQISGVWDKIKFNVMGQKLTLEHIEHKILRVKFNEPRIHMALVCAAMACPPLRGESYTGEKLDDQLDDQTRLFLGDSEKFKIDSRKDIVHLSEILKWFDDDFARKHSPERNIGRHNKKMSSVLSFIAPYLEESEKNYILSGKFKIKYIKYDWSLNEQ